MSRRPAFKTSYEIAGEIFTYKRLNPAPSSGYSELQQQTLDMFEEQKMEALISESEKISAKSYNSLILSILERQKIIDPKRTINPSSTLAKNDRYNVFLERNKSETLKNFLQYGSSPQVDEEIKTSLAFIISLSAGVNPLTQSMVRSVVQEFNDWLPALHNPEALLSRPAKSPAVVQKSQLNRSQTNQKTASH